MSDANVLNEPKEVPPPHMRKTTEGEAWLRGYGDGFKGRDVNEPDGYKLQYLRGYAAGLKARYG